MSFKASVASIPALEKIRRRRKGKMNRATFRSFVIPLLIAFCTLFYYFGELVDWAAWGALRREFFYGVHDIHRLLFLAPIIYAGYTARVKGALIVTMVALIIFLPRAFFISPFPDPLLRMVLFTIFAGVIGSLVGTIRNQSVRSVQLEAMITSERDKLLKIVDGMADGIIITGSDYRIRYMNAKMIEAFGDGIGLTCYEHLRNLDTPCKPECKILDIITNEGIGKWECSFPTGRTYEVVAALYVDIDGTVCQISIFRDTTQRKYI
ncbi:PAS domain-containing protein [Chloroflexota bacterium]